MTPDRLPSPRVRGFAAVMLALTVGVVSLVGFAGASPGKNADFDYQWIAARALLGGHDPYAAVREWGWPWPLLNPLPGVLLLLPFGPIPLPVARALFTAIGAGLLGFAVTRRAWWPLGIFVSGAAFFALVTAQWVPLLMAAALLPQLSFLYVAKPNAGALLWLMRPSRWAVVGGVALLVVSFGLWPGWFGEWWSGLGAAPQRPLITRPFGALLLLALFRWRRPEGRLLAACAIVPLHPLPYEHLPVFLVARKPWQLMLLVCGSLVATASTVARYYPMDLAVGGRLVPDPWRPFWLPTLLLVYLPALAMVLARPNAASPADDVFGLEDERAAASVPEGPGLIDAA